MPTKETTGAEHGPCPPWCAGCTPFEDGGGVHFGEEHTVSLHMMRPKAFHDEMHDREGWTPSELHVHLEQPFGAVMPTFRISLGGGPDAEAWRLDTFEVYELVGALSELKAQAHEPFRTGTAMTEAVAS